MRWRNATCTSPAWSRSSRPVWFSAPSAGCGSAPRNGRASASSGASSASGRARSCSCWPRCWCPRPSVRPDPSDLLLLAALLVGALSARALCLWGVLPIVRMLLRQRPISSRFKLVILWGGVRGAVTLALALAVAENHGVPPEVRHLVSVLATGFVLFTLLVQATTLRSLIRWLGVDQLDPVERILRTRALALTQGEILDRLSETAIIHGLDLEAADEVGALYRKRVATLEESGEPGEDMRAPATDRGAGHDHGPRGLLLHRRDGRGDDLAHRRLAAAEPDQRAARRAARRQRPALPQGGPRRDRSRLCHADRRASSIGGCASTAAGPTHGAAHRAAPDPAPRARGPDRLHPQPHPRPVRRAGERGGAARHRGAHRGHRPGAGRGAPAISGLLARSRPAASSAAPRSASSSRPTTAWPARACSRPSCCATWSGELRTRLEIVRGHPAARSRPRRRHADPQRAAPGRARRQPPAPT